MAQTFRAELKGRDWVELEIADSGEVHLRGMGCSEFLDFLKKSRVSLKGDPNSWALPDGVSHSELLIAEVILKAQKKWSVPYDEEELCHCRMIATEKVDRAIIAGAHNTATVSRITSASTACGTCRPIVQKMINHRLKKSS